MGECGESVAGTSGGAAPSSCGPPRERNLEIGFFFDGTLNNEAHALQGGGSGSRSNAPSNVALLYRLYSTTTERVSDDVEVVRHAEYLEGIGTTRGRQDNIIGAAFGIGVTGVSARVHQACERLVVLANGRRFSRITVDVFGFSRGAAAARYFVNCLNRRSFEAVGPDIDGTQLSRVVVPRTTVRFLGVFDTVAAIGGDPSDDNNADVNVHLKDGSAQAIYHLVAENEYRRNFALNSILSSSGSPPTGGVESVMPGAHSDVGGGYQRDGETLVCVKPEIDDHPTRSDAVAARARLGEAYAAFVTKVRNEHFSARLAQEFYYGYDNLRANPHGSPDARFSYDGAVVWLRSTIRLGLEKVALKLMHDRAQQQQVPFTAVPSDERHAIHRDLEQVYATLHGGRPLSDADRVLLRMNFIHWSSHFDWVSGADRSAFRAPPQLVTGVYPHTPAPDYRRIIHRNNPGAAW